MTDPHRATQAPAQKLVPLGSLRGDGPRSLAEESLLASVEGHLQRLSSQLSEGERAALAAVLNIGDRDPAMAALAATPPEAILEPEEIEVYESLKAKPAPAVREQTLRPHTVVVMKATRYCNLRCTYCRFWAEGPNQIMSFEVLARATHGILTAPGVRAIDFCWHGGEATILPLGFYRKALWLQEQFRKPRQFVLNSLQTNGTRLTPAWLEFLKHYRFALGVSLDGPPEVHDRKRRDAGGRPTSARVRAGLEKLRQHGIEHGVLMVVDDDVVSLGAKRMLDYLLEIGVEQVALLNVLPDNSAKRESFYEFPRHVEFLRDLFRVWWPEYKDRINFRELRDLMKRVESGKGKLCIFDGNCMGGFLTIEPMGEIGACDKYLGDPDYRLGDILQVDLADLPMQPRFEKIDTVTEAGVEGTRGCEWFEVCHGGCPHDRYLRGRKQADFDELCCGLEPLLSDIARALEQEGQARITNP